jgi:hypothetical protein
MDINTFVRVNNPEELITHLRLHLRKTIVPVLMPQIEGFEIAFGHVNGFVWIPDCNSWMLNAYFDFLTKAKQLFGWGTFEEVFHVVLSPSYPNKGSQFMLTNEAKAALKRIYIDGKALFTSFQRSQGDNKPDGDLSAALFGITGKKVDFLQYMLATLIQTSATSSSMLHAVYQRAQAILTFMQNFSSLSMSLNADRPIQTFCSIDIQNNILRDREDVVDANGVMFDHPVLQATQ